MPLNFGTIVYHGARSWRSGRNTADVLQYFITNKGEKVKKTRYCCTRPPVVKLCVKVNKGNCHLHRARYLCVVNVWFNDFGRQPTNVPSSAPFSDEQQHRKHTERPMPHVRAAPQHSFADMKAHKDSRKPSAPNAYAAKNAKKKKSLDKVAKQMSRHFDATAARDAVVKVRKSTFWPACPLARWPWNRVLCASANRHTLTPGNSFAQPTNRHGK